MKIGTWFRSATARLTLWYLLILAVLSILFSVIVYNIAVRELGRPFGPNHQGSQIIVDDGTVTTTTTPTEFEIYRAAREAEGRQSLVINLVIFNAAVITTGGLASYLLARRTLEPIERTLEAQIRFSSDAAHELRTPLAVMQSEIEVNLRDAKSTAAAQRELLKSNLDEVGRLRSLTDRLLLLSNFKSVDVAATSLDDAATEAINRVIPLAQAKHIGVESTVGKQTAIANADILTDTLVILLDNAIKYSPKRSIVTIAAKDQGKYVILSVSDNGPGINEQDIPHIFDRFYRADSSRSKANVEGHGLGLSIAKRSIEAMGGQITVDSTSDKGTNFTIRLNKD